MELNQLQASFRDPCGYVVEELGTLKRVVTQRGLPGYEKLIRSGLYGELTEHGLLVPHDEEEPRSTERSLVARKLRPAAIPVISYPYEWCFSQLQDAALLTLDIQERALRRGMSLKDASAFNVQFHEGRPVFIDTLSFEEHDGGPWVAYEQFCRHFLAPLLLMQKQSAEVGRMLWSQLDGVSLPMASKLLGASSYLKPAALLHIHLHARAQRATPGGGRPTIRRPVSPWPLLESLRSATKSAKLPIKESRWSTYTTNSDHYPPDAVSFKLNFVRRALEKNRKGLLYDVGGNTGVYSRLAAEHGMQCVLYDGDPLCIEAAYRKERTSGQGRVLPLVMDLSNPTPALGFNLTECASLFERPRASLVLALAVIHHLRLRENIPFRLMAAFFAKLGDRLLIEYVDPADPMAAAMHGNREIAFDDYTYPEFLAAFQEHFELKESAIIPGMRRRLLVFTCKQRPAA